MLNRWAFRGLTYLGLAFYSQGIVAALQAAQGDVARTVAGETNLSSTIAQSLILAGLAMAVARRPRRYARLLAPVLPLLCIAGLALLSALWSPDPMRTLRRATALAECLLFGLFLFHTGGLERTVARMGQVCVAMAGLSLLVYVALPGIGRETALGYEGALRGVFPQKNSMSQCMLLGLCCYVGGRGEGPLWRRAAAVSLLATCLVLGRGASALAVAGAVGLMAAWMRLRSQPVLRAGFAFLLAWSAAALATALVGFPDAVFALAGRDLSLTGRVPLWQALLPEIAAAPLLGHGYAGFWNAASPTVQMVWLTIGWPAPDAHSSYLDILLQLGLVGLALYVWSWATLFRRATAAARTGFPAARLVWLYGTALLLIGTDEGVIPIPNAWTALMSVALLALARHLALVRGPAAPAWPKRQPSLSRP